MKGWNLPIQSVLNAHSTYQYYSRQATHENEEQNQMVYYLALSAYRHNCPTQKQWDTRNFQP